MAKCDPNDYAAKYGMDALRTEILRLTAIADIEYEKKKVEEEAEKALLLSRDLDEYMPTAAALFDDCGGNLREPVIHGLLRRGETMNFIAPPKAGKSWLAYNAAMSVVAGKAFLGVEAWQCVKGNVVIVDNELHRETLGFRIPLVCKEMGLPSGLLKSIRVLPVRGLGVDIYDLQRYMDKIIKMDPRLVILDSLYRFIPKGSSENDNADMCQVMNQIDSYARQLPNAGILIIHHSSKGNQGEKDSVDVGAGAGAFARAADSHFTLRAHEIDDHFIIDSNLRSWPKHEPIVCAFSPFPVWKHMELADNTAFKSNKPVGHKHDDSLSKETLVDLLPYEPMSLILIEKMLVEKRGMARAGARRFLSELSAEFQLDKLISGDPKINCDGLFEASKTEKTICLNKILRPIA